VSVCVCFVVVEMSRRANTSLLIAETKSFHDQKPAKISSTNLTGLFQATTLVAETPPRPSSKSTLLVGDSSDDEGVPESPEVKYMGTKRAERIVPETPIKPKGKTKR